MKSHSIIVIILLVIIPCTGLQAQGAGGAVFLLIPPGARAGGMGEAQVAVANDVYATYWNPAGLAFTKGQEVAVMHTNWLPELADDIYYEFAAYRTKLGNRSGFGIHGTYLNLGEIAQTGSTGPDILDTYSSYMWAAGMSYGRQLTSHLSLGLTIKYFQQFLAPASALDQEEEDALSSTFAIDVGLLRWQGLNGWLSWGLVLSNIGPAVSFYDEVRADPAPAQLRVGIDLSILKAERVNLHLAYDVSKGVTARDASGKPLPFYEGFMESWNVDDGESVLDLLQHNIGGELILFQTLALRAGGIYQKTGRLLSDSGSPIPTLGAGIRFRGLGADFSYILGDKDHPLSNTTRFSLNITFKGADV